MENNQKERDNSGNVPGAKPLKGTYAEYRAEKLMEWRKKFNVDQNGFFKGGVPRQGRGNIRGDSLGAPGAYNDPYNINESTHDNPSVKVQVDNVESKIHKQFMNRK